MMSTASRAGRTEDGMKMRTITREEHYATPAFMDGPGRQIKEEAQAARAHPQVAAGLARLIEQLRDIGEGRIADMDAAGLDLQVLSLTAPGVEQLEAVEAVALARDTNDTLAEAVRRHPDRLAGFAALPTPDPEAAADELQRAVGEHGFKGALINGHSRGRCLDDEFFWPILACAETLGVPLYLHPTPPPQSVITGVYAGTTRRASPGCWPPPPGAGTSTPRSTSFGSSSAGPWTGTRVCSW
jgi:predicted TIM-barrel fold metal-dependent hydrolase